MPRPALYNRTMTSPGRYRIVLAKEDFKFSSAHFTVFAAGHAELLHGHNYRVYAEFWGSELDEHGLLLDVSVAKGVIRALCRELDSRTLVPTESSLVRWREEGEEIELTFDERRYRLPRREVVLLPLANSTIELLAKWFWERIVEGLGDVGVERLAVTVEETPGQRCAYEREWSPPES